MPERTYQSSTTHSSPIRSIISIFWCHSESIWLLRTRCAIGKTARGRKLLQSSTWKLAGWYFLEQKRENSASGDNLSPRRRIQEFSMMLCSILERNRNVFLVYGKLSRIQRRHSPAEKTTRTSNWANSSWISGKSKCCRSWVKNSFESYSSLFWRRYPRIAS